MKCASTITAITAAIFLAASCSYADDTPDSLLQSAASTLQATKSLTADLTLHMSSGSSDSGSSTSDIGGKVSLLRPNRFTVLLSPKGGPSDQQLNILSTGSSEYMITGSQYVKVPTGQSAALAQMVSTFVAPVKDFFDPSLSTNADLIAGRQNKSVVSEKIYTSVPWDGSTFTVVQIQFSSSPASMSELVGSQQTSTIEKVYIGSDGIIHRLVAQSGPIDVDAQLHNVVLNPVLENAAFILPKGLSPAPTDSGDAGDSGLSGEPSLLANGTVAPDFTVHDVRGRPIRLSDYRGKVVVLDFWATWCEPCQESLPSAEQFAHQYKSRGVVFLAVNVWDTQEAFKGWLPGHSQYSDMIFAIDPNPDQDSGIAVKFFKVSGIPTDYVIDRTGHIVTSMVGAGNDDALSSGIKKALL